MLARLERVRTGEVTQAVRDAAVDGEQVHEGDWIGAVARRRRRARPARPATPCASCSRSLVDDDSEIITVLVGADAPAHETERIREHIEFTFPHVEVEFHDGGQPLYPYLVGRGVTCVARRASRRATLAGLRAVPLDAEGRRSEAQRAARG